MTKHDNASAASVFLQLKNQTIEKARTPPNISIYYIKYAHAHARTIEPIWKPQPLPEPT